MCEIKIYVTSKLLEAEKKKKKKQFKKQEVQFYPTMCNTWFDFIISLEIQWSLDPPPLFQANVVCNCKQTITHFERKTDF